MTTLSPRLQSLFEKTKTVCFGRFVVEVPATAALVFGPAEVGPPISFLPGGAGEIARHIAEDLIAIEGSRDVLDERDYDRLPLFGKVIDGIVPGQKIVFDSKDGVGYYINSYVPIGKDLFVLHISSVMHEDYKVERFNIVASNLRLRADDEIPSGPGTCIDGGFLPLPLKYERVTIGVRLKEFPDVHLSIEVHKNQDQLSESDSLELLLERGKERAQRAGHGAAYARIKNFRRGPRQLGSWSGFEVVARRPAYKDDTDAHEFRFQSLGAKDDPLQPHLDIRLNTGVRNNKIARARPSLTDEEAIALWDKLISSIRVRKSSDATPRAKVPLGTLKATGEACPQQGWWQCSDGYNIEGERRRHFTRGDPMPEAALFVQPGLWQKLAGGRATRSIATVWELVRYDDDSETENAAP